MRIPVDPVGLPALAALALGGFAFVGAVVVARIRASRAPAAPIARRATASWIWIVLQGIGVASAGFGPIRVTLDPLSAAALASAAIVLLLMAAAVTLFHTASRTMGANWSLVARTRTDHQLVQAGPFAVVRHPIYVAIFLFLLALALAYGHWRNLVVAIPLYALGTWLRVRHEERLLRAQFGAAYDDYARRVRRFVPALF